MCIDQPDEGILQVGHIQKRKAQQGQAEVTGEERGPPTCSRCNGVYAIAVTARSARVCRYVSFGLFSCIYNPLHAARRAMAAAVPLPIRGSGELF